MRKLLYTIGLVFVSLYTTQAQFRSDAIPFRARVELDTMKSYTPSQFIVVDDSLYVHGALGVGKASAIRGFVQFRNAYNSNATNLYAPYANATTYNDSLPPLSGMIALTNADQDWSDIGNIVADSLALSQGMTGTNITLSSNLNLYRSATLNYTLSTDSTATNYRNMQFGNTISGQAGYYDFFTADGDKSDVIALRLFALGTRASVTNAEMLTIQYNPSGDGVWDFSSEVVGSGVRHAMNFTTTSSGSHSMRLDTSANLTLSGSLSATTGTFGGDVAVNGDDITSDGDLTITPAGGDVIFAADLSVDGTGTSDFDGTVKAPHFYLEEAGDFRLSAEKYYRHTGFQQLGSASAATWYKLFQVGLSDSAVYKSAIIEGTLMYAEDGQDAALMRFYGRFRVGAAITTTTVDWYYNIDGSYGLTQPLDSLIRVRKIVDENNDQQWLVMFYSEASHGLFSYDLRLWATNSMEWSFPGDTEVEVNPDSGDAVTHRAGDWWTQQTVKIGGDASLSGSATVGSLRINSVGSLIDSAKVVSDTLKFYVGGVAYNALKEGL